MFDGAVRPADRQPRRDRLPVIRTCRRLGIRTVAVYSEADAGAQHVRLADEAWPIGGRAAGQLPARRRDPRGREAQSGAQAIHPGYGFLSENADFAEAGRGRGLVFIGPPAASMRKMGSKAGAKDLMQAAGVPVVPGYTGEDQSPTLLRARAADRLPADDQGRPRRRRQGHAHGARAGGVPAALESCQREAAGAFGRDRVLLERYIERRATSRSRCSATAGQRHPPQRARMLGAAPLPEGARGIALALPDAGAARAMGAAAVQAARAIDYVNAGTVEFIVAPDGRFYFMEINTRLQVEHPVTEMVTGLDLVEWQLRVAAGEPLPLAQDAGRATAATPSRCGCTPRIPPPASCPARAGSSACSCRSRRRTCASIPAWSRATWSPSSTTR
jgi:3-methylcrotonyl-CoA carboxylase alpha subunit